MVLFQELVKISILPLFIQLAGQQGSGFLLIFMKVESGRSVGNGICREPVLVPGVGSVPEDIATDMASAEKAHGKKD
jgi:hypothetical protein